MLLGVGRGTSTYHDFLSFLNFYMYAFESRKRYFGIATEIAMLYSDKGTEISLFLIFQHLLTFKFILKEKQMDFIKRDFSLDQE